MEELITDPSIKHSLVKMDNTSKIVKNEILDIFKDLAEVNLALNKTLSPIDDSIKKYIHKIHMEIKLSKKYLDHLDTSIQELQL